MKVKVTNPFKDKNTGRLYKVGEELDFSVERINEIAKVGGLIELLEVQSEPTEQNEQQDTEQEREQDTESEPEEQPEQDEPKTTGRRKRSK